MTEKERHEMITTADLMQGAINRICVTKDMKELRQMISSVQTGLEKIATMRYSELEDGDTDGNS